MVKVKVVGDKLEITGIADDDLKNIKKINIRKEIPNSSLMELGRSIGSGEITFFTS